MNINHAMPMNMTGFVFYYLAKGDKTIASAYYTKGNVRFTIGKYDRNATAYGYFEDSLLTTGWGVLEIKLGSDTEASDDAAMFTVGALEGLLTAK